MSCLSNNSFLIRSRKNQAGISLIFFVLILVTATATAIFLYLDSSSIKIERNKKTTKALALAKVALVGHVASSSSVSAINYLPNPDLRVNSTFPEGIQAGSVGAINISLLGKLPWRSLGLPPLKDGYDECLWYAVSGHFKSNPPGLPLNWDTSGQIDLIDSSGNYLHRNLAAIVLSPGPVLSGQNRENTDSGLTQCRGNYDARNYLDTYNSASAFLAVLNYFSGSPNNRQAADSSNKTFLIADNQFYNDQVMPVTVDEIFRLVIRRSDFAENVYNLMNDPTFTEYLKDASISGSKGMDSIECSQASNQQFCSNWKEMLLFTELAPPSPVSIDGAVTAVCRRVLIFSGRRTLSQQRITSAEKSNPENYLEDINLSSFGVPVASEVTFSGSSLFNPDAPSLDLIRCIEDE